MFSIRARLNSASVAVAGFGNVEVDGDVDGDAADELGWLYECCLDKSSRDLIALLAWCIAERKSSLSEPSFQPGVDCSGWPVNFRLPLPVVSMLRLRVPRPETV